MQRKLPAITDDNIAFWTGGSSSQLLIHWCEDCSAYFHPPAPVCPKCRGTRVAPRAVSGRGHVLTYTINHQAWLPSLPVPYVVAIVGLAEQSGLQFLSNVVGCPPESVQIGMPVRVVFERHEDVWLPLFEPDPGMQ